MLRSLGLRYLLTLTLAAVLVAACGDDDTQPQVENTAALCADGVDNDGDGDIDCADSECQALSVCTETACDDGVDNEGDGLIDCLDPDCQSTVACQENTSTRCQDHIDNDGDGLTDCDDDECMDFVFCEPHEVDCQNGLDDDGDGDTDCDDSDCAPLAVCGGFCYSIAFERPGTFGMAITEANDDSDPNTDCVQYNVIVSAISPEPNTQICLYLDQDMDNPVAPCQDPNQANPVTFPNVSLCQGNHSLFARVEQGASSCNPQRMDVVVYENPTCTITAPAGLSMDSQSPTLTNQENMDFQVTTSGDRVELYVNGLASPTATVSGGVASFPGTSLGADGDIQVRARCHNPGSGTGETDSALYYLNKDTVPPNLQITSPTTGQQFGDSDCPITVSVTGVEAGQQVCAQVQGASPGANGCSSASTGPSDTVDLVVDCVSGDPVTLEAVTQDAHGNQATATVAVTIDNSAPSVLILTPVANHVYNKADDTIDPGTDALEMNIVACTDGNYSPSNITLTVDGVPVTSITPTVQAASCAGLTHQITWSAPYAFSQAVSGLQTPHDVQVTVSDGINTGQNQVSFQVDTLAPGLVILEPSATFYSSAEDNCPATSTMEVAASVRVSGLEAGQGVALSVENGGTPVQGSPYSATSTDPVAFTANFAAPCGIQLENGQNDLTVTATDLAGNVATALKTVGFGAGIITDPGAGALLSTPEDCDAGAGYGIPVTVQLGSTVGDSDMVQVTATSSAGGWSYSAPAVAANCSLQAPPCTHTFCISVPASEVEQNDIALELTIGGVATPGGPTGITVDLSAPPPPTGPGMVVTNRRAAEVELSWTASEDPESGVLSAWDVRCVEDDTISLANWATAMTFAGEPTPAAGGTQQTVRVAEDESGRKLHAGHDYSCGLRGQNGVGLWSDILVFPTVQAADIGFQLYQSGGSPTVVEGYTRNSEDWWYWNGIAPVGSVNGDAYDDVLIGFGVGTLASNPGHAAALFFGSASGPSAANKLELTCSDDTFGSGLAGLGDFDGANYSAGDPARYPDFAVGAVDQDRVYLFRGHAGLSAGTLDCTAADIVIQGPAGSCFGDSVAGIGDFDHDGKADIAISAPCYNSFQGAVFVVFGREEATYPVTINLDPALPSQSNADGALFVEAPAGANAGIGLVAGDFERDGFNDLVFSAHGAAVNAVYLLRGYAVTKVPDALTTVTVGDLDQRIDSPAALGNFGMQAVGVVDLDGDGCDDLMVGDRLAEVGGSPSNAGAVFVFLGQSNGGTCSGVLGSSPAATIVGEAGNDWFGLPVATGYRPTESGLMQWKLNGLPSSPSEFAVFAGGRQSLGTGLAALFWQGVSGQVPVSAADVLFAAPGGSVDYHWVAIAGDLDGDGYADLAIGDRGFAPNGRVYFYH